MQAVFLHLNRTQNDLHVLKSSTKIGRRPIGSVRLLGHSLLCLTGGLITASRLSAVPESLSGAVSHFRYCLHLNSRRSYSSSLYRIKGSSSLLLQPGHVARRRGFECWLLPVRGAGTPVISVSLPME